MDYEVKVNEPIIRGDTWHGLTFTVNKAGIDYTNATVRIHYKTAVDGKVLFQKDVTPDSAGLQTIIITASLTSAETSLFITECAVADIEITSVDDGTKTPILITFRIIKDVTK